MSAVEMLQELGYKAITNHTRLQVGCRVRNYGEQWAAARLEGTGTIVAVLRLAGSNFEQSQGSEDVEVVVLHDDGSERQWASYGTVLANRRSDDSPSGATS